MKNLTKRELEILDLLSKGFSNRKIGENLCISTHTVKASLESIYEKLDIHNRVQVSIYYVFNYKIKNEVK